MWLAADVPVPEGPVDTDAGESGAASKSQRWLADFLASTVVFLVALPLCIGIAVACGVPAERGLLTGIVGGIVVGRLAGAPLLVSGPAASLIVPVFALVETHGLEALAPVVMLAGAWQLLAGVLRLGQWFRAVAPAVIHGMLIGIGALIVASQLHVAIDAAPQATFVENLLAFPGALRDKIATAGLWAGAAPGFVAALTIGLVLAWNRYRPKRIRLVPGQLVALVVAAGLCGLFDWPVEYLNISPDFFAGLQPVAAPDFAILLDPSIIGVSLVFAFVASAATLLTANAIDQRQTRTKTNYDREIFAQGVGNLVTGGLGGLPMTGVIVRSSVNVDAGALSRWSTILHGLWILGFVAIAPQVLERIPQACLGAILVFTGVKLINIQGLRGLYEQGRAELGIALITLFGVVFIDLFVGIVAGLVAAFAKLIYTFVRLEIRSEDSPSGTLYHLHLTGSATFVHIPRLAEALDDVPADRELHIHIDQLDHIDHACLELLSGWKKRRENEGAGTLVVEWNELAERYKQASSVGRLADGDGSSRSVLRAVWSEWKKLYAPGASRNAKRTSWSGWLDASRIRLQTGASTLDDVIRTAAGLLASSAGLAEERLARALSERVGRHVVLGDGVAIPHAPVEGVEESRLALITTGEPVDVAGARADVFFVLLAPRQHPHKHLSALARIAGLCHDPSLLTSIRATTSADVAAELIESRSGPLANPIEHREAALAVVALGHGAQAERVAALLEEAFEPPVRLCSRDGRMYEIVREATGVEDEPHLVVCPVEGNDVPMLMALLDEQRTLFPAEDVEVHMLRREVQPPAMPTVVAADG